MKLLTNYRKDLKFNKLKEAHYEGVILHHKKLSTRSFDLLDTEEIRALSSTTFKLFIRINRFFFEQELEEVKIILKELINLNLAGFIVTDVGIFWMIKSLDKDVSVILETDTTMTSSHDINVMLEMGFSDVIMAHELTFYEYQIINQQARQPVSLYVFGHPLMSTSRRQLLDAYGDKVNRQYEKNHIYNLQEVTRENSRYLVFEDEAGTHIYHGKILNSFEYKDLLKPFRYGIVENINLPQQLVYDVGRSLLGDELINIEEMYASLDFYTGLWETKTSKLKEGVK